MADPLKQTAFSSISWTAISTVCRLGLQFGFSIILARLLSPADFGVMAIMIVVNAVAVSLIDSGFSQALIQKQKVTDLETSSVFLLGLATALVMMLTLLGCAPFLARFFNMPILQPVAQMLSLNFVIVAFGGVHSAMLMKNLQFKKLMQINVSAALIASVVAVVLAMKEWGVWSLVVHSLCMSLMTTLGLWLRSGWRPGLTFSLAALSPLFRFGVFVLLAGIMEAFFSRLNTLLIGKFYSANQLGYFSRAESTVFMVINMFTGVINQVAFPMFSSVAGDASRLLGGFKKAVRMSFYLQFPTMVGLFVTARPVIMTLFGSKWEAAIPYLQLFAFAGMFSLPRVVAIGFLNATGRSRLNFQIEFWQKLAGVVGTAATVKVGITAMLVSAIFFSTAGYLWTANCAAGKMGYSCWQQLVDSWRVFLAAVVMGVGVWSIASIEGLQPISILPLQIVTGAVLYVVVCRLLKVPEQGEIVVFAKNVVMRKLEFAV
jgi:O-antigen/teichoic acid export membrane protein